MAATNLSEIAQLDDELERAYEGEPWHGPSLLSVLQGVTAQMASMHPVPDGHSIWEIVVHLKAWDDVVTRRITERKPLDEPEGGNFPPVTAEDAAAWSATLAELDRQHRKLRKVIQSLNAVQLNEPVTGKDYSLGLMLHGVTQHLAYHSGQIALLKKLVTSRS